jgi:CRP-like cAMP-binding protein
MPRPAGTDGGVVLTAALQRSALKDLPPELLERMLAGAIRLDIPAGSVLYREDDPPRCGLLVSGLLRVFQVAADGRQVTIRYMTPGSLSGSRSAGSQGVATAAMGSSCRLALASRPLVLCVRLCFGMRRLRLFAPIVFTLGFRSPWTSCWARAAIIAWNALSSI